MKKSSYFLCLLLFIFPLNFSFAQEKPSVAPASEWFRLESDNGEFSVEVPADYTYFYDRDGFTYEDPGGSLLHYAEMQKLNASHGKTIVSVEIYKARSPRKHLDYLLERQSLKSSKLAGAPENFTVKQVEKSSLTGYPDRKEIAISFAMRFIASKTHLYIVTVANRGETKTAEFEKVLASIRLNENQSGNTKISTLKALTLEDIADFAAEPSKPPATAPKQLKPSDSLKNPTPLLIISKPHAPYTDAARDNLVSGTIRLRVTFDKNGGISKIGLLSGLEHGLSRSAFFAALRVKFIPEEKDGVLVTVTKTIEYTFSIGR